MPEVLSPDDPHRDLVRQRQEYAQAEIPQYWLVDPMTGQIIVLRLEGTSYVEHRTSALDFLWQIA